MIINLEEKLIEGVVLKAGDIVFCFVHVWVKKTLVGVLGIALTKKRGQKE